MNILFVEENDKKCLIKKVFKEVELKENKIIINKDIDKIKINKKIKIIGKIRNILNKSESNLIVMSSKLKKNEEFLNLIYSCNIDILDGRKLFRMYIFEIVDLISKKIKKTKRECRIALLSNEYSRFVEKVIKELGTQCKVLNIVTFNIQNFEKVEEDLKSEGIIINISNNKRKSLSNSDIILNIDFQEDVLNSYNIYDNATIVNFENSLTIHKKRFCGRIINWYKLQLIDESELLEIIKDESLEKYEFNEIMEYFYYLGKLDFNEVKFTIYF